MVFSARRKLSGKSIPIKENGAKRNGKVAITATWRLSLYITLYVFEITFNHSKNSRGLDDITSRHRTAPARKGKKKKNNVTAAHKHHFHCDAASQFSRRRSNARNELSSITDAITYTRRDICTGRVLEFPRGNRNPDADNDDRAG